MVIRTKVFGMVIAVLLTLSLISGAGVDAVAPPGDPDALASSNAQNNAGWQEVGVGSASAGGISSNAGYSWQPAVAVASSGEPILAWEDHSSGYGDIYVRRWNGSTWEEMGAGSASGGGISNSSNPSGQAAVATTSDGAVYIAWTNRTIVTPEIYVRRWNGSGWEEVGAGSASGGGISNTSGWSQLPSMAVAPDGTVYVAWEEDIAGQIYVRRWNGNGWEEVGAGSASGGGISNTSGGGSFGSSIAVAPDGTPYVAWCDGSNGWEQIYVRRWRGGTWEEVGHGSAHGGGISSTNSHSWYPSVGIAPGGVPYIAWYEELDAFISEIYVRRWNGVHWEEVGAGSASGGGISSNGGISDFPSLAVAPDGMPYVAWHGTKSGDVEIYVRRWDGNSWQEVGVGSASGGGISDNFGESYDSSLAIGSDGVPYIAWHDDHGENNTEIFIRRGPPAFQQLRSALWFLAEMGGADPPPQRIDVRGISQVITWTASVSPTVGWLEAVPTSGTTSATISATVSISGLSLGHYTAQIIIEGGEGVVNSPQTIDVRLIVAEEVSRMCLPLVHRDCP
jgi:hypothetical protein